MLNTEKPCCRCHLVNRAGNDHYCKPCSAEKSNEWQRKNRTKRSAYDKERCRVRRARKDRTLRERDKRNARISRLRFPKKVQARLILSRHVKQGKVIKPTSCQGCGLSVNRIEGHHYDYEYPIWVAWLCVSCHRRVHRSLSPAPSDEKGGAA